MRRLVFLCLALGAAGVARAEDGVPIAPPPAWVVPVEPPPRAPDASGMAPRLIDYQARIDETGVHQFGHQIFYLASPAAVQSAGTVTITWQPAYGRATVHRLVIRRGDERIDVLKSGAKFNVIQREAGLESLQLNGLLTGVLQVPDLRVGDELEFSFTIDHRNTALGDHNDDEDLLGGNTAIDRVFVRYSWPSARKVNWRFGARLPPARRETAAGVTAIGVDQLHLKLPAVIPGAPARYLDDGAIQVSDFASWKDVADVTVPLFEAAAQLPADSALNAEIRRIAAASQDPAVRTAMALQLVQTQVRYFARIDGLGGYVPQPADTVWRMRSGDCKGKTVLLLALLRGLGVEAEPAFVSTARGDGLDKALPTLARFNHVLVRAEVGGKVYWLDGTRTGDHGLGPLDPPPFKWALPLGARHRALEAIPAPQLRVAADEWRLDLDATAGLATPAKAHGYGVFRGDEAVGLRAAASLMSRDALDQQLRKMWQERHDWVTIDKVTYEDDEAAGEIRVDFTGTGHLEWHDSPQDQGDEDANRIEANKARLGQTIAPKRDDAVANLAPVLVAPRYEVVHQTILLPNGGAGFSLQGEAVDVTVGGVHYQRTLSLNGGRFDMTATTRAAGGEISFADAQAADRQVNALFEKRVFIRKAPPSGQAGAGPARAKPANTTTADSGLAVEPPPYSRDDLKGVTPDDIAALEAVMRLVDQRKFSDALAALDQIHVDGRLKVETLATRGMLLAELKRPQEANAALDQALALDRNNVVALTTKTEYLLLHHRADDALILADRLVLVAPESAGSYTLRGRVRAALNDTKGALGDWDIAVAKGATDPTVYLARLEMLYWLGQKETAFKDADALAQRFPDDAKVQGEHASMLVRQGRLREAKEASARSLRLAPSAPVYMVRILYGLSGDEKATLKEMIAEIALDPRAALPDDALRKVMALPGARKQLEAAYDAARAPGPDGARQIKLARAAVAAAAARTAR